ncbi:hypothetical protein HON36_02810 [Candidatus Parcubacteria bacterium]|jgi:hypothetical protein|nr:hypothetical protein [Candidatus Parcubacteria bacterium]MBT7228553.1 hypothetical protein [Candidatus Parcubacteria bacterium]
MSHEPEVNLETTAQDHPSPPRNQQGFWEGIHSYLTEIDNSLSPEDILDLLTRATKNPDSVQFDPNSTQLPLGAHTQMWTRMGLFLALVKQQNWTAEQVLAQLNLAATGQHEKLTKPCHMLIQPGATLVPPEHRR